MKNRQVRIGCYGAFWGDSASAAELLVEAEDGHLDYLVADYLAEVTMGLLAKSSTAPPKSKTAPKSVGFIEEFFSLVLVPLLDTILSKGIKVITNAGGLDPVGLKRLIEAHVKERGLNVKVAAVYGDNILDVKDRLADTGAIYGFDPLNGCGHEENQVGRGEKLLSLNAYIGAEAITEALRSDARIIVTGRCVDSAMVLGPLAYEYDWQFSSSASQELLDRFASASLAGHVLECGAQATGGNFTDWRCSAFSDHGGWANMGYPIATFQANGNFTITKTEKSGGLVTCNTVREQMLYEVLDPQNYILPDVVIDLSRVQLTQTGVDQVLVEGAKGKVPTPWLKCTAVSACGFRITADILLWGGETREKGIALGQAIREKSNAIIKKRYGGKVRPIFEVDLIVNFVGATSPPGSRGTEATLVRIAAKHDTKVALDIMSKEIAPFGTSSAPGFAMLGYGRPRTSPHFTTRSILVDRQAVVPKLVVGENAPAEIRLYSDKCSAVKPANSTTAISASGNMLKSARPFGPTVRKQLIEVALGRSGDKGNTANVAIMARDPAYYPYVVDQVTSSTLFSALGSLIEDGGTVTRYEVPGVHSVNFVITQCLGGGGLASLSLDRQAKGYAQICLNSLWIDVPQLRIKAGL